ncbi:MAG: nicotinate-nucleotide adenylyltransferase [Pseudomonadota bacterium]
MTEASAPESNSSGRLVVLGGTFNPVHYGHLSIASQVAWQLDATVHLLLSARPPHRDDGVASAGQRWEMLKLAARGHPRLLPDRRELDRDGPSFMVDTLESLRNEFPAAGVSLVLGSDAAAGLASWHRSEDLARLAHLVVVRRPGMDEGMDPSQLAALGFAPADSVDDLDPPRGGRSLILETVALEISASAIRELVRQGGPINYMTPPAVVDFLTRERLYVR